MCFQGVWFIGDERRPARGKSPSSVPRADLRDPGQLAGPSRHLRHRRRDNDDEWVDVRGGGRLHRHDGRVGLRGVGHRLLLPAVLRLRRLLSVLLPALPDLRLLARGTTRGPARTDAAPASTARTAAPASARATTRAPAPTRAAPRPTVRTARAASAQAYNPRTGTYAQTRQGSNVYGSWGSTAVQRGDDWAKTNRYTNRRPARRRARSGPTRAARSRARGAGRRQRSAAGNGGNVYAGQRRQRLPQARTAPGRSTTTAAGRTPTRQPAATDRPTDRVARPASSRPQRRTSIAARSDQLNRDSAARSEGAQRTSDYGNYRGGSGTRGTGSYRGGGGLARRRRCARRWRPAARRSCGATRRRAMSRALPRRDGRSGVLCFRRARQPQATTPACSPAIRSRPRLSNAAAPRRSAAEQPRAGLCEPPHRRIPCHGPVAYSERPRDGRRRSLGRLVEKMQPAPAPLAHTYDQAVLVSVGDQPVLVIYQADVDPLRARALPGQSGCRRRAAPVALDEAVRAREPGPAGQGPALALGR